MPLALLGLMIALWIAGRAVLWDNPIAHAAPALSAGEERPGLSSPTSRHASASRPSYPARQSMAYPPYYDARYYPPPAAYYGYPSPYALGTIQERALGEGQAIGQIVYYPVYAAPAYAPRAASTYPEAPALPRNGFARAPELARAGGGYLSQTYGLDDISRFARQDVRRTGQVSRPGTGSGLPPATLARTDRWMLDAFGFYRQGSSALSIPQGRSPVYGASQLAANLQWRARPSSSHDPRIFLRAYQAQVDGGESEIAAGVSGRPIGTVPVRLFAELRATQSPSISDFGVGAQTRVRPAAYAATELGPKPLPMGFSLETYAAAGYVAGSPSTYFLDGQAVATRELLRIGKPGAGGAVSVGGGVWGGAQRDAKRLDVGPTLRFDVDIGKMPARVSVDYREQVAGDAEPDSGLAATVSTRF
ncbi:hypothetical protein INR77_05120 [Erythrobacter sp. SCSIO 43205]|uniref:hypothetical protein n=1 Tax=Erythrobacter sp. SCSIO 43205 TaxID=2779361 RepID=UPI001CA83F39|nr:hypothetical protein [Erythrobacter sp. SCSIO 43205]UAB79071.1 hypothetical protein INR77_05120 [Erythrobacter sp. SCSIO 43205]